MGGNGTLHHEENGNGDAAVPAVVLRRMHPCSSELKDPDGREDVRLRSGGTIWVAGDDSALTAAVRSSLRRRGYRQELVRLRGADTRAGGEAPCGLIVIAPEQLRDDSVIADAFRVFAQQVLRLCNPGGRARAALLTVSRLDGRFGVNGLVSLAFPTSGALAGMVKTAGQEWPGVDCKAVDLDPGFDSPESAADMIVEELLKRGPAEVGMHTARAHFRGIAADLEPVRARLPASST